MSGLQFQSFTSADFSTNGSGESFSGKIGDKNAARTEGDSTASPRRNLFSFGFYQQFFDVDTEQVTKRLLNSFVPTHNSFITDFVQPIPDLYGPFWISVTLVFSIGIFSNIAQYIENEGTNGEYGSDFRMVTGASSLITTYVLLIPFLLYSLIWYRKSEIQYSYLEILCAYGYSLSIFIPLSVLWVIDVNLIRWSLIVVSVALSGSVLAKALWPAFRNDANKMLSGTVIFGVLLLHFLLALAFKEYFFDAMHTRASPSVELDKGPVQPPSLPDSVTKAVPVFVKPEIPEVANSVVGKSNSANDQEKPSEKMGQRSVSIDGNKTENRIRDDIASLKTEGNNTAR